jgi:hypothetical protein
VTFKKDSSENIFSFLHGTDLLTLLVKRTYVVVRCCLCIRARIVTTSTYNCKIWKLVDHESNVIIYSEEPYFSII